MVIALFFNQGRLSIQVPLGEQSLLEVGCVRVKNVDASAPHLLSLDAQALRLGGRPSMRRARPCYKAPFAMQ